MLIKFPFLRNCKFQEPGSNEEIQGFLSEKFPLVNFPVFGKTSLASNPVCKLPRVTIMSFFCVSLSKEFDKFGNLLNLLLPVIGKS